MSIGILGSKQTAEEFYVEYDFGHDLPTGATIASTTVVVVADSTGATCTAALTDSTKQVLDGLAIFIWVKGGASGQYYTLTVTIKTNTNEIYELDGRIYVQDLPAVSTVTTTPATWAKKQATAERLINKYGAAMTLSHITKGAYNATLDEYAKTTVNYTVRGVLVNPTQKNDEGVYGKSDKTEILLAAKNLPDLVVADDWKITCGVDVWYPERIVPVKPGGTTIIYLVYLK